jgi:hypothetical protein
MPELTFADHQDGGLPSSELIGGRLDHIHDVFLGFDYEIVDSLPAHDGDMVILIDSLDRVSKLAQLARHNGQVVLVAAPSDAMFRTELPVNVLAAFVSNNELNDARVTNVPVGIRRKKVSDLDAMRLKGPEPRDRLLYANFTVYRLDWFDIQKPHIRHSLAKRFANEHWVTTDLADRARTSKEALHAYYRAMARHKFALSPEGLGVDCYRHWECLYLGTIPIIRTSPTMTSFSELPILFTEDYSEIEPSYLETQWREFRERRFDLEKLRRSYYRRCFLEAISRLSNPRFVCWGFRNTSHEAFLGLL